MAFNHSCGDVQPGQMVEFVVPAAEVADPCGYKLEADFTYTLEAGPTVRFCGINMGPDLKVTLFGSDGPGEPAGDACGVSTGLLCDENGVYQQDENGDYCAALNNDLTGVLKNCKVVGLQR